MNQAAVSYVEHYDRILSVWNSRYGGWTLPGGKVEFYETPAAAQMRELFEETGLRTHLAVPIYTAETCIKDAPEDRGRMVHVFRVTPFSWDAREVEPGHPVTWFTREEFLKWSPFAEFYVGMFEVINQSEGVEVDVFVCNLDLDHPMADMMVRSYERTDVDAIKCIICGTQGVGIGFVHKCDRILRKSDIETVRNAVAALKQAASSLELEGGRPDSTTREMQALAESLLKLA